MVYYDYGPSTRIQPYVTRRGRGATGVITLDGLSYFLVCPRYCLIGLPSDSAVVRGETPPAAAKLATRGRRGDTTVREWTPDGSRRESIVTVESGQEVPTPTTSTTPQPVAPSTPSCPPGYYPVDLGGGRYVCRVRFGR